jgi:zinc protease
MSTTSSAHQPNTSEPGSTGPALTLVPPLGPSPQLCQPDTAERMLASGLRVIVARHPNVPLVEVRLRVPFTGITRRTQRVQACSGRPAVRYY